jgi:hypothetical protein
MKQFFIKLSDILESLGRARAASELARCGRHTEARALILGK